MGQQNSAAQDGKGNQECASDEPTKEDKLSISKKNDISESIQCVRARIDMLIEDCLTGNELIDGVFNRFGSNGCCINNIINDTSCSKCEIENEKFVGSIENIWEKMNSGFESKETKFMLENKEPKCKLESKLKELETGEGKKMDKNECLDKCGVKNDYKFDKAEKDIYSPDENKPQIKKPQLAISDLISDIVNSEMNQSHIVQLQKRTVTTFNTFVDKVLDSSLKIEFMDKPKPTNTLKLGCTTKQFVSNFVTSEIRKSPNGTLKTDNKIITLKDQIENILEESIKDDKDNKQPINNFKIHSSITNQEKFSAQGRVNNLIAQALGASKQNVDTKWVVNHTNKDHVNTSQTFLNKIAEEHLGQSPKSGVEEKPKFTSANPNNVYAKNERINKHSDKTLNLLDQWPRNVIDNNEDRVVNEKSCHIKEHLLNVNSRSHLKSLLNAQPHECETYSSDSVLQSSHQMVTDSMYSTSAYKNHDQCDPNATACEMRNSLSDGKQFMHIEDCQYSLCAQPRSSHVFEMPRSGHYGSGKISPNFPQQTSSPLSIPSAQVQINNMSSAMMRPSHQGIPQGYSCNPGVAQLLPHHPPVVSNKVNFKKSLSTADAGKACLVQPVALSMLEQPNMYKSYLTEEECSRNDDFQSRSSSSSLETPLDLTVVKYAKSEPTRQYSSTQRKITTPNAFIKQIENSVDRHWLGLTSPLHSPGISGTGLAQHRTQCSRSATSCDIKNVNSPPSPNSSCSPSSLSMLHGRFIPSPHLPGGITTEQPLVDSKLPALQCSFEYHHGGVLPTGPLLVQQQHKLQAQFSVNHLDFGTNGKHNLNNISKHEPVQNIMGHHDQSDILYLICRLCTQTYGSPYGFRKHFRNQHGFEPLAEHMIVQTISAKKSLLHGPSTQLGSSVSHEDELIGHQNVSPESSSPELKNHNFEIPMHKKFISLSPPPEFNVKNFKFITESNRSETKCLECPECGKSFQLNDFGSYKHHCRQHGNLKMNGPSMCSDCHLPFPDQKLLNEYYLAHAEDSLGMKQDRTSDKKSNPGSPLTCYSCLQCSQQFDEMHEFLRHKASHDVDVKQLEKSLEVLKTVSSSPGIVQQENRKDVQENVKQAIGKDLHVNFVTSDTIVQAASESLTFLVSPDSSSNSSNKNKKIGENMDEAGQKVVKNCNYTGNNESRKLLSQEITLNCNSNNSDNRSSDESEFMYKHKKFSHQCKRTHKISSNELSEVTDSKIRKAIDGRRVDDLSQGADGSVAAKDICDLANGAKLEVKGLVQER